MSDQKLEAYRRAEAPLPEFNRVWPLYGAGFENLGRDARPIDVPMPTVGPDQLLVRHDACGICFSDIKVIRAGQDHPRIYRNMQADPVVLGHEITVTVAAVGEQLRDQYRIGDRFLIQADIYVNGVSYAYGYEIPGGYSWYGLVDQRVLNGDHGNYLVPVRGAIGYAESALVEPWACVVAAYRLEYRTGLKSGGTTWIIGAAAAQRQDVASRYTISSGFDASSHPARLLLTNVPDDFAGWLRNQAGELGVEVMEVADVSEPPLESVDDIVILGADVDLIEAASPHLAQFGIVAIVADEPLSRKASVDIGRVHYNRWTYVGGPGPDIAQAYHPSVRPELKPGGRAWFVGAGGPLGRMHVQRAIEKPDGPQTILCTALQERRLRFVESAYRADAEGRGLNFVCVSRAHEENYQRTLEEVAGPGFDDIIVMAPSAEAVAEASAYLAPGGVMNVFAGLGRGTLVELDLSPVYRKGVRYIGHSGSSITDMELTLAQTEKGELSPNRLVSAIGSLGAVKDGLRAVNDSTFPGKVVIFPHVKDLPLTALPDLRDVLPAVYAKLKDGSEWTKEAEEEFLRIMLS